MPEINRERVLIVNDDPSMLELLQRNLCSRGYAVVTSSNVNEAVRILAKRAIDLVITDLILAKAQKQDLIAHIQQNYHHAKVIIVTGYATIREATGAAKAGAGECLIKPFTDEELFTVVQRVCHKPQAY